MCRLVAADQTEVPFDCVVGDAYGRTERFPQVLAVFAAYPLQVFSAADNPDQDLSFLRLDFF